MLSPPSRAGYLSLLVNQMWREQWCCVCQGALHFYHDKGDARTSMPSLPLHGCEVVPGLGPKHPFAFRILQNSTEVAALEVKSAIISGNSMGCICNRNVGMSSAFTAWNSRIETFGDRQLS